MRRQDTAATGSMAVIGGRPVDRGPGRSRSWVLAVVLTSVAFPARAPASELRMVLVPAEGVRSMEANQRVVTGLLEAAFEDVEAAGEALEKRGDLAPILEVIAGAGRVSFDLAAASRRNADGVGVPLVGYCGEDPRSAWTRAAVTSAFRSWTAVDRLVGLVESMDLEKARRAIASARSRLEGLEGAAGETAALLASAETRLMRAMRIQETGVAGPFADSLAAGVARLKDAPVVSELCRSQESRGVSTVPADRDTDSRDDSESPDLELAQVTRMGALGAIRESLAALDAAILPEGQNPEEISRGFEGPVRTVAVPPVYSNFARMACMEGGVRLRLAIDRDGIPRRVRVLRGAPELAESAVAAARQWKFEPARLDGKPVAFDYSLIVNFNLQGAEAARCKLLRTTAATSR